MRRASCTARLAAQSAALAAALRIRRCRAALKAWHVNQFGDPEAFAPDLPPAGTADGEAPSNYTSWCLSRLPGGDIGACGFCGHSLSPDSSFRTPCCGSDRAHRECYAEFAGGGACPACAPAAFPPPTTPPSAGSPPAAPAGSPPGPSPPSGPARPPCGAGAPGGARGAARGGDRDRGGGCACTVS